MKSYRPGESLTNIIQTAIPDFVESEYPLFLEFVQCYLRYLEQERTLEDTTVTPEYGQPDGQAIQETVTLGGTAYETRKFLEYRDIDKTLDEFTKHFLAMFAKNFPRYSHIPADLLIRSLRDFYRAKGTTDSIKWFFRVFFNEHASVYFPREDVLRASHGTWKAPITLKVSEPIVNPDTGETPSNDAVAQFYIGQRVQTATGTALVENVITNIFGQAYNERVVVNELTLKFDSILGTFEPGQTLFNVDDETVVYTTILPVISSVTIHSGGSNYAVGDIVTFSEGPAGGYGYGAYGVVAAVASTALNGINVIDGGRGYVVGQPVTFTSSSGSGAAAIVSEITDASNTIPLQLTIEAFVAEPSFALNSVDYGAESGVAALNGTDLDSNVSIALEATDSVPFMHPWVFTNAEKTEAELANAMIRVVLTSNNFFEANTMVFTISNATDLTTNLSTSGIKANVIVSDITTGNWRNTLYFNTVTGLSNIVVGKIFKADGEGNVQPGTVVTDGTANVAGTNTTFTTLRANVHIRFADGTPAVIKSITNNTLLQTYSSVNAIASNTFSVIPTGTVSNVTFQSQVSYGTISAVQLTAAGANYLTPPFVSVESPSAQAQELFYQDANGDIQSAGGTIDIYDEAELEAEQSAGQVTRVNILGSGVNYTNEDDTDITFIHGDGRTGTLADASPVLGALTQYSGYFTTTRGFLSSDKYLQDRNYYNDYTYVVRVAESFDRYRAILRKLLHPAGFQVLGGFVETLELPAITMTAEDAEVDVS